MSKPTHLTEIQIRTHVREYFNNKISKNQNFKSILWWQGWRETASLIYYINLSGEQLGNIYRNNSCFCPSMQPFHLQAFILQICSHVRNALCTRIFIKVQLEIVKEWKRPQYPSTGVCLNKAEAVYTIKSSV